MRLPEMADGLASATAEAVRAAGTYVTDALDAHIRLGVTGLSRAGKTVLITGLVRALTQGRETPAITWAAGRSGATAYLEPQPDDDIPRFAYEDHLAALAAEPPQWPQSTRRISQLRLTLTWDGDDLARRWLGLKRRLHIDIVDYPGEWLTDLGLIEQDFQAWSLSALAAVRHPRRAAEAAAFLALIARLDAGSETGEPERIAIEGARLYTAFLEACRAREAHLAILGPGRFLMPGDLEGSPLLTFFPLPSSTLAPGGVGVGAAATNGALGTLLSRRFESYKTHVAIPFFRDHFARLDRQIVLVDVLSALESGPDALAELEDSLDRLLAAFKVGANSWLSFLSGRRIDRILFAASKADHLNRSDHARLTAILDKAVTRAKARGLAAGTEHRTLALAALRATEDVETVRGGERFSSLRGRPMAGERLAGRRYSGEEAAVVFPGDLPKDPLDAFDAHAVDTGAHRFVRFAPPRIADADTAWPHLGLGTVVSFLVADRMS